MKRRKSILIPILFLGLICLLMDACAPSATSSRDESAGEAVEEASETLAEEYEMEAADEAAPAPLAEQKRAAPEDDIISIDDNRKPNTEEYDAIVENPFLSVVEEPLSTFSIDVDNAAYSNVRRFINQSQLPPPDAVRIEEMINYFSYDYPQPKGDVPFSINTEVSACPWNNEHQLVHIGLQGKSLNYRDLKPCNLVFLVDASGSMEDPNKLPLLKKSLGLLLDELGNQDRIAIVAYAGAAGLVLPSTPAKQKSRILSAMDELQAGGSTAGGEGIELAYKIAKENLISGGNNRVILATDGDFNVGQTNNKSLVQMIEEKRKDDIYLTICGFGMGNYKDNRMEQISNAGNGNYFYIDNIKEAEKVFVKEMRANLFTIAKDVKIQIEFNPVYVKSYRLIGYENRKLRNEDFDDDTKDAGELGAGHTVTAIYELVPNTGELTAAQKLSYQQTSIREQALKSGEMMQVKFRYKPPKSDKSKLLLHKVAKDVKPLALASENFRFSAAVAEFGLLLRNSDFKGTANFNQVLDMAKKARGKDAQGYRSEFISLVDRARLLK